MTAWFRTIGCLLIPLCAAAAKPAFTHQARVIDSAGDPITGVHDVLIGLYDAQSQGEPCWEQTYRDIRLEQGYFAVSVAGVDASDRALGDVNGTCRWLSMAIDNGANLGPRQPVPDHLFGSSNVPGSAVGAPIATLSALDGTPRAVGLLSTATALSFGWTSGGLHTEQSGSNTFLGFSSDVTARTGQQLLNYTVQGNDQAYTVQPGVDRYLLVYIDNQNSRRGGHNVTEVTYAGAPMTNLGSLNTAGIIGGIDSGGHYLYGIPLGSGDIATSGVIEAFFNSSEGTATIQAHMIGNVDQDNPVAHTYASIHRATRSTTESRGGLFYGTELEAYGTYQGQNTEGFVDTVGGLQHATITAPGRTIRSFKSTSQNWTGFVILAALRTSKSTNTANVQMSGTVTGFTGLTTGALYYLSQTEGGGISTTVIGRPIGVAVSETELFILPRN